MQNEQTEELVKNHYSVGNLAGTILSGLEQDGKDLNAITAEDLSVVDEFHIGGHAATRHLLSSMALKEKDYVLDVGSGIGGAARTVARSAGCKVTGIDLTPEYVETAETLSHLVGMDDQVSFKVASALSLPFDDNTFDAAITIHVAMNIADRDQLYSEIQRVLKPGAMLALYDVMKTNNENLVFPLPWAMSEDGSFLVSPDQMLCYLETAGFDQIRSEDRSEFALKYFDQRIAAATDRKSALGPHMVMGPTARQKFENVKLNMRNGRIAPVVMTATSARSG